jgi:hypothetical protein
MPERPPDMPYEREEYIEQSEEEREAASRTKSLVALGILSVLVIAGIVLVHKLRDVSALQDCLMTKAANCTEIVAPTSLQPQR